MQNHPYKKITRRKFLQYGLGLPTLMAGSGYLQTKYIHVAHQEYQLPYFKPKESSFTIGILSDFHAGSLGNKSVIKESIELLAEQKPDLICLLGDFVDGEGQSAAKGLAQSKFIFTELTKLSAPHGIFAVLGNHDHWIESKEVTRRLKKQNIHVLSNSHHKLRNGLIISGVDDLWSRSNINQALKGLELQDPTILLSHNPDINYSLNEDSPVGLVLSGHTHGGQVRMPFINWAPWTPCSKKYHGKNGLVRETTGRSTYITNGVGTFFLPLRFFCPPEVTILSITADIKNPLNNKTQPQL